MRIRHRRLSGAALTCVASVALIGCLAGTAQAAGIAVTASPNPARWGATVTLTNTGSTNQALPEALSLIYDYYEPNTLACAPTAAGARARSHGEAFITTIEQNPSAAFSDQTTFVPRAGAFAYRLCVYLYSGGDDSVAPDASGSAILAIVPTRAQLIARAIKKCQQKASRMRRARCIKSAMKLYAPPK
jgi:hypothetical protein